VAAEAPAAAMGLGSEAVEDSSQEAVEEEGDSTHPVATTNGQRHDSIYVLYIFLVKRKNCKKTLGLRAEINIYIYVYSRIHECCCICYTILLRGKMCEGGGRRSDICLTGHIIDNGPVPMQL
jgi:hypothetical protein